MKVFLSLGLLFWESRRWLGIDTPKNTGSQKVLKAARREILGACTAFVS